MAAALPAVQPPLASASARLSATYHRNLRCRLSIRNGHPRSHLKVRVMAFADGNGRNGRGDGGGEDLNKGERRPGFKLRWRDLLDPDPDNILAVGLTGVLAWASVQVLWQLFFISVAILLAALKYSFIAALLLFILITLL